jgi:hypothetical protein
VETRGKKFALVVLKAAKLSKLCKTV